MSAASCCLYISSRILSRTAAAVVVAVPPLAVQLVGSPAHPTTNRDLFFVPALCESNSPPGRAVEITISLFGDGVKVYTNYYYCMYVPPAANYSRAVAVPSQNRDPLIRSCHPPARDFRQENVGACRKKMFSLDRGRYVLAARNLLHAVNGGRAGERGGAAGAFVAVNMGVHCTISGCMYGLDDMIQIRRCGSI